MEVKFAQLLEQHGVSADQTTTKIRDLVKVFDEAWGEYQQALENLESADPEDEETLAEEVREFESDLAQADAELCKKINEWVKMKDKWEVNKQKMAEGRAKKAAQSVASTPTPEPTPQPTADPIPQPTPDPIPAPKSDDSDEEGGSGWLWFAGLVAVVTLGAVVLKRR